MALNVTADRYGKALKLSFWALLISVAASDSMPALLPIPVILLVLLSPTILSLVAISGKSSPVAGECHRASLFMERLLACVPGNPFSVLAARYLTYATHLQESGRQSEAEEAARTAISIAERNPADQGGIGEAYWILSFILLQAGKGAEADEAAMKAKAIYENAAGKYPEEVAQKLTGIALARRSAGHGEQSEQMLLRAISLIENSKVGPAPMAQLCTLAGALNNLACCYDETARYGDAVQLFHRALKIKERVTPNDQRGILSANSNLGFGYLMCGKFEEAEQYLNVAHDIAVREKWTQQGEVYSLDANRARLCHGKGQFDEGLAIALENEKRLDKTVGINRHTTQVDNRLVLGMLYRDKGDYESAKEWFQKCAQKIEEQKPINRTWMGRVEAEQAKLRLMVDGLLPGEPEATANAEPSAAATQGAVV